MLGEVIEEEDPLPISVEAAFARLLQIRTLKAVITAFAALGFGLFTVPILGNLFMEDEYGLGSFGRGAVGTVSGVAVMISVPFIGKVLRPAVPQGSEPGVAVRRLAGAAVGAAGAGAVLHAERGGVRHLRRPDCGADDLRVRHGRARC